MGLTAATYLGENTVPILAAIAERLGAGFDPDRPRSSADARRDCSTAGGPDLMWACGRLTAQLVAEGVLDGDVVAAPVFAGQQAAVYHSVLLARPGGPASLAAAAGARLAVNEAESWSGHHALLAHLAGLGLSIDQFSTVEWTGSHRASVAAVAEGRADMAAIDHTVWEHLGRSVELVVIDRTRDWPAPPFTLRRGASSAARDRLLAIGPGDVAGLDGIEPVDIGHYQRLL